MKWPRLFNKLDNNYLYTRLVTHVIKNLDRLGIEPIYCLIKSIDHNVSEITASQSGLDEFREPYSASIGFQLIAPAFPRSKEFNPSISSSESSKSYTAALE